MDEKAREAIVKLFCDQRGLSPATLSSGLREMISAACAPYFLFVECLADFKEEDPVYGLFMKLLERVYGATGAMLGLIALGHIREAEILARPVLESSVTLWYIAAGNQHLRFAQFFTAYINQERDQNRRWKNDLGAVPEDIRNDHLRRIADKERALDEYEKMVAIFAKHCGVDLRQPNVWPNLIDRLTTLGRRIDYRTVYAAMCSQSHHDAEDILNAFVVNSVPGDHDLAKRLEQETDAFSIFMCLFALSYFVEAVCIAASVLKFGTPEEQGRAARDRVQAELEAMAKSIAECTMPDAWRPQTKTLC